MIEPIMYFGIGFLFAALIGVAAAPFIHDRAARLTMRRLENSIPQSMAEIQADKDLLRAEFAMSARQLEIEVEKLKEQNTSHLAELGRKKDAINRFKIEHEAQKVETVALKSEVVALKDQLTAAGKEIEAIKVQRHADDLVSLAPKGWPASEELLNHAADACDPDQRVELAGDRSEVGARLQAAELSIRVSPSTGIRIPSNFLHLFMVGLVGFGAAFAWQQYQAEGAKELIGRVSSLGSFLFESTTKSPLDVNVAAKQTGVTPVPQVSAHDAGLAQPEPITPASPAPAAAAIFPEQSELAAKQQQLPNDLQAVEQETKQETSFPPALPETGPTPLEGWSLREVTAGIAVLEGPTGIWRVTPGDTLPGVGKVESYIRSNGQWIVATSSGLISMPVRHNEPSPSLQNDPKFTPTGETTPKTIEAWTLHEVTNGAAVLEGPIGTLRVTLGDTVAGFGKVTAIVRWGKGWVVTTSAGYCTSAPPDHADGICKPYRRD